MLGAFGTYQSTYPKFGFINMVLEFVTSVYDEMARKGEIPVNSRIPVFVLDV